MQKRKKTYTYLERHLWQMKMRVQQEI